MEESIISLSMEDEEEEIIQLGVESFDQETSFANYFVGMGVSISDLGDGRFLVCLYFEVDVDRFEKNRTWNFNSHLLMLYRLQEGENPMIVQLYWVDFWVFTYGLPHGLCPRKRSLLSQMVRLFMCISNMNDYRSYVIPSSKVKFYVPVGYFITSTVNKNYSIEE
ncbi:hypothetical protein CXB51_032071 [Gossypium anomalum]|uniref:DUF4283 domain-containing protein n=1 Tax=Gossypium anomalum TaxID=47600 RepID=A0A8J5Y938_9ROSI|nr:hypothetical protein CXB51_032071 [Gossypium anomalum]